MSDAPVQNNFVIGRQNVEFIPGQGVPGVRISIADADEGGHAEFDRTLDDGSEAESRRFALAELVDDEKVAGIAQAGVRPGDGFGQCVLVNSAVRSGSRDAIADHDATACHGIFQFHSVTAAIAIVMIVLDGSANAHPIGLQVLREQDQKFVDCRALVGGISDGGEFQSARQRFCFDPRVQPVERSLVATKSTMQAAIQTISWCG